MRERQTRVDGSEGRRGDVRERQTRQDKTRVDGRDRSSRGDIWE